MKSFIFVTMLLISSCSLGKGPHRSNDNPKGWSDWGRCGVEQREMRWDHCKEDLHGESYDKKGFCYAAQYCRTRRTMWPFNNLKTQKKRKILFCSYPKGPEDREAWDCMNKHGIDDKVIMTEPQL